MTVAERLMAAALKATPPAKVDDGLWIFTPRYTTYWLACGAVVTVEHQALLPAR